MPSVPVVRLMAMYTCLLFPLLATADDEKTAPAPRAVVAKGPIVHVTVDTTDAPELREWGEKAKELIIKWHPIVSDILKSDGYSPPTDITVKFKKKINNPAFASGKTITISAEWVTKHPDDYGMVVHEMTHVIQQYRRAYDAGWLVEGIADYIRFYKFEPQTRLAPLNPAKAKYKDAYRTTAQFLNWIVKNHDKDIVVKLNTALRQGEYKITMFEDNTGMTVDELWAEFMKTFKK